MSQSFTIIGDPHLTSRVLDKGKQLFNIVENLGNPCIWLGDLLHNKEVIRGKCLNLWFDYFKTSTLKHYIIVGNHDWFNHECEDYSLRTLTALPNVIIFDKVNLDYSPFVFIPYIHESSKIKMILKTISTESVVIGHFDVAGYDYGNGHVCKEGLNHEDLAPFKRVISGHFHKMQQTGSFLYLGTPFSHSFGEANQNKGIAIYTPETDELNILPTNFPRHVSLKLDLSKSSSSEVLNHFIEQNKTNIIRVQLFGSTPQCASFDKTPYEHMQIKWENKSLDDNQEFSVDESLDNKTQFMDWATGIKKLDSDTVKLGLEILETLKC
jgi:DNA repair exonuclease SbcCD nuclease subunit